MKLSFIIPVYNVEKYIAKCLDSLLDQDIDYTEYEIICINDCSPDNSKAIIQDYQLKYPNIVLIDTATNIKAGGARNLGLKEAKGEYVWFIDSDDWIMSNCIKNILAKALENNLDVLCFNYSVTNDVGDVIKQGLSFAKTGIYNGFCYIHKYFEGDNIKWHLLGYSVRALIRKAHLIDNNILYPENIFFQDTTHLLQSILFANKVESIEDCLYCYRMNYSSVTNVFKSDIRGFLIYQYAFCAGDEVYKLSELIYERDKNISNTLLKISKWYFNNFIIRLAKTSYKEKKVFYEYVELNKVFIDTKFQYLSFWGKLLLNPIFGLQFSLIFSVLYSIKSKLKKK